MDGTNFLLYSSVSELMFRCVLESGALLLLWFYGQCHQVMALLQKGCNLCKQKTLEYLWEGHSLYPQVQGWKGCLAV